jgi:polynucleotide 5'-hydroxyl-kinase GRC3/NOL9
MGQSIRKNENLLKELEGTSKLKLIYVIGDVDTGKTTFCKDLFDRLSKRFKTAYIDCDPGQSFIGPPAALGMQVYDNLQHRTTEIYHFVGSTTPLGHLLQTLSGIKKLTQKAITMGAERVVLDSSGFVNGNIGLEFQYQIIDLIQPHHLIALQKENELNLLLLNFRKNSKINIHDQPVSKEVNHKTFEERKTYREQKFQEYFSDAALRNINTENIGFHGRIPPLNDQQKLRNLLISFSDQNGFVLSLGILKEFDKNNCKIKAIVNEFDFAKITTIHFGSIRLDLEELKERLNE